MNQSTKIKQLLLIAQFFLFFSFSKADEISFNFIVEKSFLKNAITKTAIYDAADLLKKACDCTVTVNGSKETAYKIALPLKATLEEIKPNFTDSTRVYPYLYYPQHNYSWNIITAKEAGVFILSSPTYQGVSAGIYGLLQEVLGFKFYHPKEMIIPQISHETIPKGELSFSAEPKFEKKGFHLHTMHPIELTEQLLDHNYKNGIDDIKQYIDWLARNQQNYFEFNLLESIEIKEWVPYISQAVDYMHRRGIIAGLDLSLHMKQQKAFMLYNSLPKSFRSKKYQIKKNVDLLCQADWDVWSVEFSSTEFTSGNVKKKQELQLYLNKLLIEKGVFLTGRKHVVKSESLISGTVESTQLVDTLDKYRGTMSHTVMFYSSRENKAPVYGNVNLKHMYDYILQEKGKREVWYYPESAYWVTFDSSVPMFLMPYLTARLEDIQSMDSLNVEGHLTFSSGWEWNYWLFDWSIARWSWKFEKNNVEVINYPTQYLDELFPEEAAKDFFKRQLDLQQVYMKDSNIIQYMAPSTVTDEMWGKLSLPFQPRPEWKYKYLQNKSDATAIDKVSNKEIPLLNLFASKSLEEINKNDFEKYADNKLFQELIRGIKINALRANHKVKTLEAILAYRNGDSKKSKKEASLIKLKEAKEIRDQALQQVKLQEGIYRYPIALIVDKRWDHTCYHFGYLYTVSNLHFWEREEMQIKYNKWSPFYKNIYNIPRTIGLVD